MAVATRFSFQSGFFGYLSHVESQSLESFAARLGDEYRRNGDWGFLQGDYGRLRSLAAAPQPVQRLALLDADKRTVVGNPDLGDGASMRPVLVDDRVVGWIARSPYRRISTAADLVVPAGAAARGVDHRRLRARRSPRSWRWCWRASSCSR
mgnify:CR=1 FL=1